MYSTGTVKTEVFLHHSISDHQREAILKCLSRLYLKYSQQYFELF